MIDPEAQSVLDELARRKAAQPEASTEAEELLLARQMTDGIADFSAKGPEVGVKTVRLPDPNGGVNIRLYRPASEGDLPVLVWCHGGGAIAGSLDTHDAPLRSLCAFTGWAVVSVGYRLAPEATYPSQHEDCLAAVRELAGKGREWRLDPETMVVGGDSIGGLFAMTVTRLAFAHGMPPIAGTIMLYPNTDLRPDRRHPSLDSEDGNVMTRRSLAYENDLYVPNVDDRFDPLCSPLLASDLGALPPTLVVTCEHDPLRDEGEAMAARLREAGVAVHARRLDGMIHALLQLDGRVARAAELRGLVRDFLSTRSSLKPGTISPGTA